MSESIKHLIFRSEPDEVQYPMYRSKFSKKIREDVKRRKECHRTMGLPKELIFPTPLKKGTRIVVRPDVDKGPVIGGVKSFIPTRNDWMEPAQRDQPNFLVRNILKAIRLKPPQGPSRAFDTASHRRFHACNLLQPKFVFGKDFGKVPKYLGRIRKLEAEKKKGESKEPQGKPLECAKKESGEIKLIAEEERLHLIEGLKRTWEELSREFSLLPVIVDSVPMIRKKKNLENSLDKVEKELDLLERHKYIFVYNDSQAK